MNIDEQACPHLPKQTPPQEPSHHAGSVVVSYASYSQEPEPENGQQSAIPKASANTPKGQAASKPRILVMHASVGSGHRSAALAIAQAFELLRDEADLSKRQSDGNYHEIPSDLEIEVIDILDWGRIKIDGDHAASLFTGATRPLYDLTWRYTFTGRLLWGGGTSWSRVMYPLFTQHLLETRPMAIVCTHITAANVAVGARMLCGMQFPIVCVPTDYETEGLWPHHYTDLFCVANESMAETLRPRKVPEHNIAITGIPTREDFRRQYDKEETRRRFNLPLNKTITLALAGAYLPRPYIRFREALDKALPFLHRFDDLHLVFVAGNDDAYAHHVRNECLHLGLNNVTVLDYVDDMAALMSASDLVICKSGGLTVTECLCSRAPMILLGKAYGQEKINVSMLTSFGAAMHVTTARELLEALDHIQQNSASIKAMLVNGSFLRRPNAARDIANLTLQRICEIRENAQPGPKKHFVHLYWGGKPAHTR